MTDTRPVLLDLFCGAGGAAMGYHRAGFEVVGVDSQPQPRYPFRFIRGDALEFAREHGQSYQAIHASPPCQRYSQLWHLHKNDHPDLVGAVRDVLQSLGRPWVIENVMGAPLQSPVRLCGTMFGLTLYRHRGFESNTLLMEPAHGIHRVRIGSHRGGYDGNGDWVTVAGHNCRVAKARSAMQCPWMTSKEIVQAIPPAYTEYIGRQLINHLYQVILPTGTKEGTP